jgi:hypothetical protein
MLMPLLVAIFGFTVYLRDIGDHQILMFCFLIVLSSIIGHFIL